MTTTPSIRPGSALGSPARPSSVTSDTAFTRGRTLGILARRYVVGPGLVDALAATQDFHDVGIACTVGHFAPVATQEATAVATTAKYLALATGLERAPATTWMEVDLSHVGLGVSPRFCQRQLRQVADRLPPGAQLQAGAEDSGRTDAVLEVVLGARRAGLPIRCTVQANLRRSPADVSRLLAAGVPIRLVMGGFPEPPALAWPRGRDTEAAFLRLAGQIHRAGGELAVATHDELLHEWARDQRPSPGVEMLLGVRPDLAAGLARRGHLRLYLPYGDGGDDYVAKRLVDTAAASRRPARHVTPESGTPGKVHCHDRS